MTQQAISQKNLILIVDDDTDILKIFKDYLTSEAYNVHAFSDAEAAYEHFCYTPKEFSLVLSDIRMPSMNGFELTRKIKAINSDAKVILMSSFPMSQSEVQTVLPTLKVDGIIDKPITLKTLSEIIQKSLGQMVY